MLSTRKMLSSILHGDDHDECYNDVHVSMKTDDMRLSTTTTVLEGDAYG